MHTFQKILVPIETLPYTRRTVDFALDLALRYDAEMYLLLSNFAGTHPKQAFYWLLAEDEEANRLAALSTTTQPDKNAPLQKHDVPIYWTHLEGQRVAPAILRFAEENQNDLIVLETHTHRNLRQTVFGGMASEVVRWARCPVLTIRKPNRSDSARPSLQHILVPVDFSPHSRQALHLAKELAALYEASLSLLFVNEEHVVPFFTRTGTPRRTVLGRKAETTALEALRRLNKQVVGPERPVACHMRRGQASHEILQFAVTQKADLIIISSHGLTNNLRFTLGSVAEKVLRRAPCPVLVLKAEDQPMDETDIAPGTEEHKIQDRQR